MPVFVYKGVNQEGRKTYGEIAAENDKSARNLLRDSSIRIISISEKSENQSKKLPPLRILAASIKQLSVLLQAGFPVDRAIFSIASAQSDLSMKTFLFSVYEGVMKGGRLSEVIEERVRTEGHNTIWDELAAMIKAGEASGELSEVLKAYSDLLDKRIEFRRKMQGALFYPLILLVLSIVVIAFLFSYVLPTITALFQDSNMRLPAATRILLFIVNTVKTLTIPVLVAGAAGFIFGKGYIRTRKGRRKIEEITGRIPGFGRLFEKAAFARWSRSIGSLLDKGVEIRTAMKIAAKTSGLYKIEDATEKAEPDVAAGVALASALSKTKIFPPVAIEAVTLGEGSGTLPKILIEIASAWESEVEAEASRFADIFEPLVLVIMGSIIGGIVLAILLPIFEFNASVK